MTRYLLHCEGRRALWKEQTCQKRIELRALQSCHDGPIPLLQEELEPEKKPLQIHLSQTSFNHISTNSLTILTVLMSYGKPLKRLFDRYQSHFEAISIGQDIRQINW